MSKDHKHLGAWGDDSSNHLPGLFGFMAPRVLGMLAALMGVFLFISGVQWAFGVKPTLIVELYTQLFT